MRKPQPIAQRRATTGSHRPRNGRIRAMRPPAPRIDRRSALGRLLPLWPHELEDESVPARLRIIARLRKVLRAERRRGLAGHWTYDLAPPRRTAAPLQGELTALRQQLGSAVSKDCNEGRKLG